MCVITGNNSARHNFTNHVGIGSRSHDLEAVLQINFETSSSDAGTRLDKIESISGISPGATLLLV